MKAKTCHFPITDFGGRGGLNVPFNLSKIVALLTVEEITWCVGHVFEGFPGNDKR